MAKYINPFTDWGFKRLFGQEFSKELLISFLNDLFEGEFHIENVTFKDKEQLPSTKDVRGSIFDIYCEIDDGKHVIIEMQNSWVPLFINRSICYASEAIASQREREKTKDNPTLYQLVPVYTICLMNYQPKEDTAINKFKTDVMLREKNSEAAFSDRLRFIYLSLPFFKKKMEECVTDFDKWIYVLKHMEALERIPFTTQKKIFEKVAKIADCRSLSKADQEKYNQSRNAIDDYYSGLVGAWLEGEAKGIQKGKTEGIAEGKLLNKLDTAKKMLTSGFSDLQIFEITGLTQEQLDKIKD